MSAVYLDRLTSAQMDQILRKHTALRFYWSALRSVLWHARALYMPAFSPEFAPLCNAIGIAFTISALCRYMEMRDCGGTVLRPW